MTRSLKRKFAIFSLVLSLAVSQSGCLFGIVFWPLWVVGTVVGAGGVGLTIGGAILRDLGMSIAGVSLLGVGVVLDTENPGRSDALNELPLDEAFAKEVGVRIADIRAYNKNLASIQALGFQMREDLNSQLRRDEELSKKYSFTSREDAIHQLSQDPEINQLVEKYGFENAQEFFGTFNKKKLPLKNLRAFALKTNLTEAEAKLFLYSGFLVKTE